MPTLRRSLNIEAIAMRRPRVRLRSLMLFIGALAIVLGLLHEAPEIAVLGLVAALLLIPPVSLTRGFAATRRAIGRPLSASQYVASFVLSSLAAAVAAVVALVLIVPIVLAMLWLGGCFAG